MEDFGVDAKIILTRIYREAEWAGGNWILLGQVRHQGRAVLNTIVIIIIICNYNPLWLFAFSAKSLQVLLSTAVTFQFLTSTFLKSSITSSCHRCLGLPTGLVPIGFKSNSFLVGLDWSIF